MFGSAILDVIIGLIFVYLILSLICSAINEYIASLLNKRGKMLVRGIQSMLRDVDLDHTIFRHPLMASYFPHHGTLAAHAEQNKRWLPGFRWLRRLLTWVFSARIREARYPSYVSARVFATAFLEQAGYVDELLRREEARRQGAAPSGGGSPPGGGSAGKDTNAALPPTTVSGTTADKATSTASKDATPSGVRPTDPATAPPPSVPATTGGQTTHAPSTDATPSGVRPTDPATPPTPQSGFLARLAWWRRRAEEEAAADKLRLANAKKTLDELMSTFQRDAAVDGQFAALNALAGVAAVLPDAEKAKLVDQALLWRNELESVVSSVETWFNNSMDRVSGAYKRHTQIVLLFIGLVVAFFVNADTIQLWKRLSTDPKLREGLAAQAAASVPQLARLAALDSAARVSHDQAVEDSAAKGAVDSSGVTQEQAKAMFDSASALLERTNLDFGWSWEDAQQLGFAVHLDSMTAEKAWNFRVRQAVLATMAPRDEKYARDSASAAARSDTTAQRLLREHHRADFAAVVKAARERTARPEYAYAGLGHPHWTFLWAKLLGLLLTTFALSLGAPFWFDTLNKIINIRAAGRAPATAPAPTPADGTKPATAKP